VRKEVWFGLSIMAMVVLAAFILLPSPAQMTNGHLGLLMLALVVVAIMLGFPTAFTLMGMGMVFAWIAYKSQNPRLAVQQTLDLMVQRTYSVMSNDVLISIPLFVFMGYLIERANLIEKLFKSMHLATARVPGSLAVATIITCAIFATATGIVGAVVTLMGLLALPAMLRAGYSVQLSAGAITAGGCLGILIPPSVMLIVYGATAGVSVVKLYAGAFFPGLMLAGLYIIYVVIVAKLKPHLAPPMSAEDRRVPLPPFAEVVSTSISNKVLPGLIGAIKGKRNAAVPMRSLVNHLFIAVLPALAVAVIMGAIFLSVTKPVPLAMDEGLVTMGGGFTETPAAAGESTGGLQEPVVCSHHPLKQAHLPRQRRRPLQNRN
jgi:TRAP-type mannitol/chloroaromatic compound transport system permease large subunit